MDKPLIVSKLDANIEYMMLHVKKHGIHLPHGSFSINMTNPSKTQHRSLRIKDKNEIFYYQGFQVIMDREDAKIVADSLRI